MIHRLLYYSQLRQGMNSAFQQTMAMDANKLQEEWAETGLTNVCVFACDLYVCVYAEAMSGSSQPNWDWPMLYERYLEKWPCEPYANHVPHDKLFRLAIPMIDVFHDGIPKDKESWHSDRVFEKRRGAIARLKPEMVSSYIFYHYQKQEETPDSFNQTYMIGSHGRLLFSYHELPAAVSTTKREGLLRTHNSPENWHEVMLPHFEPWEELPEGQRLWRTMERLI